MQHLSRSAPFSVSCACSFGFHRRGKWFILHADTATGRGSGAASRAKYSISTRFTDHALFRVLGTEDRSTPRRGRTRAHEECQTASSCGQPPAASATLVCSRLPYGFLIALTRSLADRRAQSTAGPLHSPHLLCSWLTAPVWPFPFGTGPFGDRALHPARPFYARVMRNRDAKERNRQCRIQNGRIFTPASPGTSSLPLR